MHASIRYILLILTLLLVVAQPHRAFSQDDKPSQAEVNQTPAVDPALAKMLASPRETIRTFLTASNENRPSDVVECLDLSDLDAATAKAKGLDYAYKLKYVIDRMLYIDYALITDDTNAKSPYILAADAIYLKGQDKIDAGAIQIQRGSDGLWRFSKKTRDAIEEIYPKWKDRPIVAGVVQTPTHKTFAIWLEDKFPASLQKKHFLLPDYQWICLLTLIFLGFLADFLVRVGLHYLALNFMKRAQGEAEPANEETSDIEQKAWRPMGLLAQALVWYGGTTLIGLPGFALMILLVALKFFAVVAGVWTAFRLIDLLSSYLAKKALGTETKFDDLLVPLVSKSLKIFVICIGLLTCAQAFSLPIAGLLGGLGLGGMAVAFAAKDAVANVFGSVTVLVDRPFEIGDWIITDGVEGSVETVGFRSTRIRTFYNSLVTVPNSRLTTSTVDNMGRRHYRRIKTMLSVQYDTTPEKIDAFCEGIRELIRLHPYTRKDYFHVYLNAFSASSLDILLYCFLECPDWSVELQEKHRLFSDIIRLAQKLKVSFAFPTQTLHMFQEQQATGQAAEIPNPEAIGRRLAADIVGPIGQDEDRPGS